jgi:predicted nucleotidyltransferase
VTLSEKALNSMVETPVTPIVSNKLDAITDLARKHGVLRLFLFGSGVSDDFDRQRSDLDFLVEFEAKSPSDHANSYFGLMEDLEQLFGLPVDLVEPGPISNPYFREEIERTKRPLYEAA